MRFFIGFVVFSTWLFPVAAFPQTAAQDDALLARTRGLYDAPFTRDLVSFDCAVQFDWKQHFVDLLHILPPAAAPIVERLQPIKHRVFVDHSGAVLSDVPAAPELSSVAHATELEGGFKALVAAGLNAWLPSATNVILPVGPIKFNFETIDAGYRLTLDDPGVAATLLLAPDLRLTSGVSQLPQSMRFTTKFGQGPNGFLLNSITTGDTTDGTATRDASFSYMYQSVQGFELPSSVTIKPAAPEIWHYALTDCKVQTGIRIKIGLPKN
ncbi:MAG TPA: hypothetical protein VGU46_01315 [Acidobacteriaceae bacterium]|nr:hypothetical protein [Acidobacteriaceae bacterium]